MFSCGHLLLVVIVIVTSIVQISVPSPIHEVSKAATFNPRPSDKTGFPLPSRVHPRRLAKLGAIPKTYIRTPSPTPPGYIAFKFLVRGPNYEILPLRVGALALHTFYTSVALLASTIWPQTRPQARVLTITHGALQLTMSGLGTVIPWDFVEDWAMRAAESVARGWTDTFDAGYEVEETGVMLWVSLRLLEGLVGNEDAMDVSL